MNPPDTRLHSFATAGAVIALLAVIFIQIFLMARANSATWDEPDHIYSAYLQATRGDFGLNPEHPPLIKYIGALPLLKMQFKIPPMEDRPYRLQEAAGAESFSSPTTRATSSSAFASRPQRSRSCWPWSSSWPLRSSSARVPASSPSLSSPLTPICSLTRR